MDQDEYQKRQRALELAVSAGEAAPEGTIERAESYYKFLKGDA